MPMDNTTIVMMRRTLDAVRRVDRINQRLITLLMVFVITAGITAISIAYLYFTTDYTYSTINQNQITGTEGNAQVNIKGKGER